MDENAVRLLTELARRESDKGRDSQSEDLVNALRQLAHAAEGGRQPSWHRERVRQRTSMLKELHHLFIHEHSFQPGQIVRWKRGLKNRKKPDYDEPAIVLQTLNKPIFDPTQESGSAYFQEPLDLVIGIVDKEDELLTYHFDSRRFEPYEGITERQDHDQT